MRRSLVTLATLALGLSLTSAALHAQPDRVTIQVTDVRGNAIPFAFVQITKGVSRVADDSGRAVFAMKGVDSLNLQVRRIGFDPFSGWAKRRNESGAFVVDLIPLPRTLDPVTIAGRRDTPLARTGFYDRVERIQRGSYSARMITPEEMDLRNPIRLSQVLAGESMVKVTPYNGKAVLMGRGIACAMTILLDGQRLTGTYEEAIGNPSPPPMSSLASIDEIINAQSIAAIEVYGSAAAVPAELQRVAGGRMAQGCGLVAIWTGSRR
ncbi:MAG: hypothetical protein RLZZ25_57 [Gemmatimonadota bacterium]